MWRRLGILGGPYLLKSIMISNAFQGLLSCWSMASVGIIQNSCRQPVMLVHINPRSFKLKTEMKLDESKSNEVLTHQVTDFTLKISRHLELVFTGATRFTTTFDKSD